MGVAVHATVRSRPSRVSQRDSRSVCGTPFGRARDRHSRRELVLVDDEVEEGRADEVLDRPRERVAEGAVRAVRDDPRVVVGDDDEARDGARDRVGEVPLALQLDLAPLAVGDVDPARDDPHDVAVLVRERGGVPGDHALLALRVREGVLVRARREARRRGVETLDHRVAFVRVDEDVPEVAALDAAPVLEPARDLDGPVEVADPPLGVDDREEARRGVDDRREEPVLRADLGLQALLLERERRGRRHRVDQLALMGERPVVEQRGDPLAAVLDERRGACALGDRVGERATLLVDPRLALRRPVGQLERGVAERFRERVAERHAVAERDREVGDPRPRESRPEDAREERDRDESERDQRDVLQPQPRRLAERADDAAGDQRGERLEGEEVHRPDDAPERRRRGPVAVDEPHEDDGRHRRGEQRVRERHRAREPVAVGDEERALRTVAAGRDRRRVDEHDGERPERDDHRHREHDPAVALGQAAHRIGEDELRERDEREAAQRIAEREERRVVRGLERPERPEEPDGEHLPARPVVRPPTGGDRPRDGEDDAGGDDEHDERLALAQRVGEDEPERAGVEHGRERHEGGEPPAGHGSSERTAAPLRSAFEMKPRAPLEAISPL